ncbi:Mitochondrial ubiquitin ligase activator of NFKB 1, partial [Phalacrocorax carbo]
VGSVKETLSSQFVENCKGVVQRLTLQEHKMVWNRTTHLWNDYEKIIHQRTNTTPFDLVSQEEGAGVAVRVMKPLDLQPPKQGMPYYLSAMDFDSLLQKQESNVRFWKILTVVFGFATCAILFFVLRKQYRHHRERQHLKQMQDELRQAQEMNIEGGETLKNACVICLGNTKSCVFLECGHVCSCTECYRALPEPKRCPICRQPISRVVPLYNS